MVCYLVLGLFLFVILAAGVKVVGGGGCGSGCGQWWMVAVGWVLQWVSVWAVELWKR